MGWLSVGDYHPLYRKKFTIAAGQISGAPTNISVALVIASDADLAAEARSDAHDLAITKGDGTTELDYERVAWNSGTGALEIWFKAPDPESGDDYYLYYGDSDQAADRQNATGVWDADFKMVLHMQDETTSTILDSTPNNHDQTKQGANDPIEAPGLVGKAQDFSADYITCPDSPDWHFADGDFTIELIVKFDTDQSSVFPAQWGGVGSRGWVFYYLQDIPSLDFVYSTDGDNNISFSRAWTPSTATWYHLAVTRDGANGYLYVNGSQLGLLYDFSTDSLHDDDGVLRTGSFSDNGFPLDGLMDEVRVSKGVARSANWLATNWNNQKSPAPGGTFWSALGTEQTRVTKQVSLDAYLINRLTKQVSLDAVLVSRFTKQTSLDALLEGTFTKQVWLDVLLQGTFTEEVSLDALLQGTFTKQVSLDALLQGTFTKQVSLDALLQGTFTKQVSLDADLKGTLTKQVALDSYLTKETGYKVIIYDSSGNALARVGDHQNLRVRQRVNKTYQLEFDLHRDSESYQHLAIDNLMEVRRNEVAIFAGIIKKPGPKFGEDGKATQYVHIFAPSFEIRQDGRRVLPPSGADYMEVTDYVDDAMKYMVRYNAVTGYVTDAKRVLTGLSVEDDKAEHPSSKKLAGQLSGGSLLEHLMRWGDAYSVDFWVDADIEAGTYVFRTKYPQRGLDRTVGNAAGRPHTIFSVSRGNVLDLDYWEDGLDACSLVYVGGPGEGEAQTIRKVYSGAEPEGNARREHFIGAADTDYDDELDAAGQAYLATWGDPIKGVRFKFQETDSCKYGRDFNLGTLVTVYDADYGISLDRKIEEIEFALGEDGIEEIFLTVGSPQPTQWEMWQARMGPYESFSQASDGRAPDDPTGLSTYSRFKAVHLTWTNPTQRDLSHIEVWRNSSGVWAGATKIAEVDGTSYTDPIGIWDSTFYYALKAVDHVGNTSEGTAWVLGNTDTTAPAAPTGLSTTPGTVMDADGHIIPYIDASWTDSATEDVQSHEVEAQYYLDDAWQDPLYYGARVSPRRISPAPGNVSYRVRVRALDDAGLPSAWTGYDTGTTAKDNVAPATPANLSVEPAWGAIVITVDVPSEGDWGLTEFHVSTTSGFTPSSATLAHAGKINRHNHPCDHYVTYYVKVRHRDTSENWSNYCAQGSAKPLLVGEYCDIITATAGVDGVIYIHEGITADIESSFIGPDTLMHGLAYDGANLISTGGATNKIYKHSGITSTITDSFNSPGGDVSDGLAFDPIGEDLISCDYGTYKIYRHSGISATITTSWSESPELLTGLTFDGENLIRSSLSVIYIHSGITSTVRKTFDAPGTYCYDLTYDPLMNDLLSVCPTDDKVYVHSGVTDTIRHSFGLASRRGITLVLR